jgi:hypothetical protein
MYAGLKKNRNQIERNLDIPPDVKAEFFRLDAERTTYLNAHRSAIELARGWYHVSLLLSVTLHDMQENGMAAGGSVIRFDEMFGRGGNPGTIDAIFPTLPTEFRTDIQRIRSILFDAAQRAFGGARVSKSTLAITDRTDIERGVKIGAEPVPSCQHYDSKSDYNLGLLAYLMDPNVKIIQVLDAQGKIIARSILRLLEDQYGRPQLFLERIYASNRHRAIDEAIVRFVQRKSVAMGVHLYSHVSQGFEVADAEEEVVLSSHASRSPYVYTDAGGGRMRDGVYTIELPRRIIE